MNILYIGERDSATTSGHRLAALERLGHSLTCLDLRIRLKPFLRGQFFSAFNYRTGYRTLQPLVFTNLKKILDSTTDKFDLVWVNSGELLGKKALQQIKLKLNAPVILYNNDDLTSGRDGRRWDSLLQALPEYDLLAIRKNSDERFLSKRTSAKILKIWMSYDEVKHAPIAKNSESEEVDVAFVGTWMRGENREVLLRALYESGLTLKITGSRWEKSRDKDLVRSCWSGGHIAGADYVKAISEPKVTLGLLSKGNRDLHTRRSLEIPYAGGLLCAERTQEHSELYREDEEAVFWSSTEECIEKCKWLIANPNIRQRIRVNGMLRVRDLRLGNENICQAILKKQFSTRKSCLEKMHFKATKSSSASQNCN